MTNKIEQYTEALVVDLMDLSLDNSQHEDYIVHPQGYIPSITKIENLLKEAGGKPKDCELSDFTLGGKGKSKPEFIVTFTDNANTIIVIECKKQIRMHKSE